MTPWIQENFASLATIAGGLLLMYWWQNRNRTQPSWVPSLPSNPAQPAPAPAPQDDPFSAENVAAAWQAFQLLESFATQTSNAELSETLHKARTQFMDYPVRPIKPVA